MVRAHYRASASMMTAGLFSMGVDWNWSDVATTRKKIATYSPNTTSSVYRNCAITLPPSRLQSRMWYSVQIEDKSDSFDKGPGQVCWAVDAPGGTAGLTVGEIWVEYRVILSGTTA